jgi:hypothetical protein
MNEDIEYDYMEANASRLSYDNFTGTYWLQDEEWEEPIEFTEDELINEGIYLNEFNQRV